VDQNWHIHSGSARIFFPGAILLLKLKTGGFSKKRGGPPQTEGDFLLWRGIPAARAVFATAAYTKLGSGL